MNRAVGFIGLALLVVGLLWFVWPTPYVATSNPFEVADRLNAPGGGTRVVWPAMHRNRFTGAVCRATESCWTRGRWRRSPVLGEAT